MSNYFESEIFKQDTDLSIFVSDAEFVDCEFEGVDFQSRDLTNIKIIESRIKNCNLSNTNLSYSIFRDIKFSQSKLIGLDFSTLNSVSDLSFDLCILDMANLSELILKQTEMTECRCRGTDFTRAKLAKSNFTRSDFDGAIFYETDLRDCDFSEAVNYRIDSNKNFLKGSRFSLPEAVSLLEIQGIKIN